MRLMRSFFYFIKEALLNSRRNFSTALGAIVTIFLSLLIIGVFLIGGIMVEKIVSSIEDKVTITAYVSDDASEADIATVQSFISGLTDVQEVSFTTKEEALVKFKDSMTSSPEIIDQLDGQNPLPASIDVELTDPQQVEVVAEQILANTTYQSIVDNPDDPSDSVKYGQQTVDRLFQVTNYVRYIGLALVVLLTFVALIFINNTIRLAILARRKEIAIMRLVGASNGFIRGPFLMEGALQALVGAGLAIGCIALLREFALPKVANTLTWLPITIPDSQYVQIYAILLGAGLVIGLIGSAFAMRRYLKV